MSDTQVVVHGFETSNNVKVRVALGYKAIPYTFATIDPADRGRIHELSGQHLTPVLVHGDRVVFDSAAILRYLDLAFPDTPRLFGGSREEQWEIEEWELFARATLAGPMMELVHARVSGHPLDAAGQERCADAFARATDRLAERMAGRTWLAGDTMTAADITAAAVVWRVRGAEIFPLPAAAAELVDWEGRVMAHDGVGRA